MSVPLESTEAFLLQERPSKTEIERKVNRLGLYFLLLSLESILLTGIPVISSGGYNFYKNQDDWYTSNDLIRLLEPFVALPLQVLIFLEIPAVSSQIANPKRDGYILIILFSISAGINLLNNN